VVHRLIVFTAAGLVAQFVDGSLGMGYGVTSTSLLVASGTAAALASATVHLAEVGTTLMSGVAHHRFGNVDWRAVRWMAVPGALGAFAGATVLSRLPVSAARPWVALALAALGVYVIWRSRSGRTVGEIMARRPHRRRFFAVLGTGAGFLDAAGGGGWGPVGTSTLLAAGRMEPRRVVGTVSASEFLVALGASAGFLAALPWHRIDPVLVAALLLGGAVAAPLAAWVSRRVDHRTLGTTIGVFIVATNIRTLAGAIGVGPGVLSAASALLGVAWVALAGRLVVEARRPERAPLTAAEDPVG
jgi:uncharacterized membrane protein YfcA